MLRIYGIFGLAENFSFSFHLLILLFLCDNIVYIIIIVNLYFMYTKSASFALFPLSTYSTFSLFRGLIEGFIINHAITQFINLFIESNAQFISQSPWNLVDSGKMIAVTAEYHKDIVKISQKYRKYFKMFQRKIANRLA